MEIPSNCLSVCKQLDNTHSCASLNSDTSKLQGAPWEGLKSPMWLQSRSLKAPGCPRVWWVVQSSRRSHRTAVLDFSCLSSHLLSPPQLFAAVCLLQMWADATFHLLYSVSAQHWRTFEDYFTCSAFGARSSSLSTVCKRLSFSKISHQPAGGLCLTFRK